MKYRHEAWQALTRLQSDGLIRSIGVSNFMIRHLEELKNVSNVVPAVNQVERHPLLHEDDLLKYCKENNILLQAYSSLGTSSYTILRQDPIVASIAMKLRKSPSQVLLRWAHSKNIAVIPKASSKKHLDENINLDFTIPAGDMNLLDNFGRTRRFLHLDPHAVV